MRSVEKRPRVLILRMRQVQTIDASGLHSMNELFETTARRNIALVISAVRPNVRALMDQAGFTEALGVENFCDDIFIALDRAKELMAQKR
jgi:SulP family sulfate permease